MNSPLPRLIAGVTCFVIAITIATWDKWALLFRVQTLDFDELALEEQAEGEETIVGPDGDKAEGEPAKKEPTEFILDLQSGESLYTVLRKQNITPQQIHQVVKALRPLFNPRNIRPDHDLHIVSKPAKDGDRQELLGLTLRPNMTTEIVLEAEGSKFRAKKIKLQLLEKNQVVSGKVDYSLYADAKSKNVPDSIINQMIRGFSYDVDFQRSITPGTEYGLYYKVFENERTGQQEAGDLQFAYLKIGPKTYKIYRYTHKGGTIGFYNGKGETVRKTLLKTPVDGARLSSGFGMRRHPVLGYSKMHKGIDFAAPIGTPIMAAGDGKVIKAGKWSSYGNYVRIQHNKTYATAYAHMHRYGKGIKVGKWVRQGQIIGYVGRTGRCTGPHLHYEVLKNGVQVNPTRITQMAGNKLKGQELKNFLHHKKAVDGVFETALAYDPQHIIQYG